MADASPQIPESTSTSSQNLRLTKRKLEDAFDVLDHAVNPTPKPVRTTADGPSPLKRPNTVLSIYSTLAKYGVKSKETSASDLTLKKTPHLTAILSKAAAKTKKSFAFKFNLSSTSTTLSPNAEYRPSSLPSFLSRLATYKLTTYANKPTQIDAVAASKCGWINEGKDRLVCALCTASWVVAGREGLSRDAANTLVEKQRTSLIEAHKQGCPWKTGQCDDSIYCIPLQSPGATIKEIKSRAEEMVPVMKSVSIQHPLTQSQLSALKAAVTSYTPPRIVSDVDQEMDDPFQEYPESSILASLFGWSLAPAVPPKELSRRSGSVLPSSKPGSPFATPSKSRASSVIQNSPHSSRQSTPTPVFTLPPMVPKVENALLQCNFCQRRVGLWGFITRPPTSTEESANITDENQASSTTTAQQPTRALTQRSFDLLKEHRSFCPYTVRSTIVPSLPVPPQPTSRPSTSASGHASTASISQFSLKSDGSPSLEGWRAVLTVVLRYGMAQKQRTEYNFLTRSNTSSSIPNAEGETGEMEVDSVKAMVAGVKSRGGKDLLKYVKGLLA